jgi:hypothetical protein
MTELRLPIAPDLFGVCDGREVARALITTAYRLLAPYAEGCPACTDRLFTQIANEVTHDACAATDTGGRIEGLVLSVNGMVAEGAPDAPHSPRPRARGHDIAACMRVHERAADHEFALAAEFTSDLADDIPF